MKCSTVRRPGLLFAGDFGDLVDSCKAHGALCFQARSADETTEIAQTTVLGLIVAQFFLIGGAAVDLTSTLRILQPSAQIWVATANVEQPTAEFTDEGRLCDTF